MSSGLWSLIQGHWLGDYWFLRAQPPFFIIPSFAFKLTVQVVLLRSFRQSFMRWSGLPHLKQFWFFSVVQLNHVGKMDNISYWLIHSSNSTQGFCILFSWRLSLFFTFWLYAWVFFSSSAFCYSRVSSESIVALQLPRGKQIPWCLWPSNIQYSSCGGLWEQRISGFCPSFQFLGCKEQVGVASKVFAIHFVGQHVLIFRVQALIEMIPFHLLYVLLLNPSWVLQLDYLDLLWQVHPKFSHILLEPCLRE